MLSLTYSFLGWMLFQKIFKDLFMSCYRNIWAFSPIVGSLYAENYDFNNPESTLHQNASIKVQMGKVTFCLKIIFPILINFNGQPKFVCHLLSFKRVRDLTILCYENKRVFTFWMLKSENSSFRPKMSVLNVIYA